MSSDHPNGWSEAELHAWLANRLEGVCLGEATRQPIHDAVVLGFDPEAGHLAACCDRTEVGVHFTCEASMEAVAHKAVGRSLSDLAASAAHPTGLLLALAAPRGFASGKLRTLLEAVIVRGAELGAPLLGGDLTASGTGLSLVVTALGRAPKDPPGRDRLQAGDWLFSTGPMGGSRLGRHLWIEPRLVLGEALYAAGARAMMDVSDGLALDVSRLAKASEVVVELTAVAVHDAAWKLEHEGYGKAIEHALFDGEDHELIVGLSAEIAKKFVPQLWPLGRVRATQTGQAPGLQLAEPLGLASQGVAPPESACFLPFDPLDPRVYIHGR